MYPESKSSDGSREISKIQYYKCQVRGSSCEISEEYDVKPDYTVLLATGVKALECPLLCPVHPWPRPKTPL